jgi:hypothetical protein
MRAVSFDSDHSGGDGASPFFFSQVSILIPLYPPPLMSGALCAGSGSGKDLFFGDSAN